MLALLESSEARVHIDARRPGVKLPVHLLGDGHVCLDYGYSLRPVIPDLTVDDEGISATLSFRNTPTPTFVPWSAIYLISNFEGRGAVWQSDIPDDMMVGPLAEGSEGALEKPAAPPPRLAKIPSSPILQTANEPTSTPKPRPSHLKLVK